MCLSNTLSSETAPVLAYGTTFSELDTVKSSSSEPYNTLGVILLPRSCVSKLLQTPKK